nr:hypothetical protein [Tanacetum cinerariifolium]
MFLVYGGNPKAELRVDCYCDAGFETDGDETKFQITPTKHGRMTKPYSSLRFIANCFNAGYLKMEVKPSSPTHTHVADEAASTGVDVRQGGAATTVSSLDAG